MILTMPKTRLAIVCIENQLKVGVQIRVIPELIFSKQLRIKGVVGYLVNFKSLALCDSPPFKVLDSFLKGGLRYDTRERRLEFPCKLVIPM